MLTDEVRYLCWIQDVSSADLPSIPRRLNQVSCQYTNGPVPRHIHGYRYPLALARQRHGQRIGRQAGAVEAKLLPSLLPHQRSRALLPVGRDERLSLHLNPMTCLSPQETIACWGHPHAHWAGSYAGFVDRGGYTRRQPGGKSDTGRG